MGLPVSGSEHSETKMGLLVCGLVGLVKKKGPLIGIRGIQGHGICE